MFTRWHAAYASAIGTSHEKSKNPCQDACGSRIIQAGSGQEIFLGIVSDGAGSASRSEVASSLVVEMFLKKFTSLIKSELELQTIDRSYILSWLNEVRSQIFIQAKNENLSPREFACTIVAAIVGIDNSIFFQVGDGAIVVSESPSNDYGCIFWPQHGEFINQTNFIIQENLSDVLEFEFSQNRINRIALFTDGIERLVLNFSDKSVYPPSLNSIFEWLQNTPQPNPIEGTSQALNTFLNSPFINNRTDDDKSLVMASRILKEEVNVPTEIV